MGELTRAANKHLLPVGPWPMVYYPLKKLVGAGVTEIMLVTGPESVGDLARLLGSGREHGCNLSYRVQDEAGGIAQALGLAEHFCDGYRCVAVLGDNVFWDKFAPLVMRGAPSDAAVVLKRVADPERYGVATISADGDLVGLEEKPERPDSDYAVVGVYAYPPDVFNVIRELKPSARGELEITDVNREYLRRGRLGYRIMGGYWIDAGTPESLAEANAMVRLSPPEF